MPKLREKHLILLLNERDKNQKMDVVVVKKFLDESCDFLDFIV